MRRAVERRGSVRRRTLVAGRPLSASIEPGNAGGRLISPSIGVGLIAAIAAVLGTPLLDHSPFESGPFDTLMRLDHALPLAGLSIALAIAPWRRLTVGLVLLAGGIAMGALLGDWLARAIEEDADIARYALLVGPLQCVVVGMALAAPASFTRPTLALAALLSGIVLGLPVVSDGASWEQIEFTAGALVAQGAASQLC